MYATCLFCHAALGSNEVVEHFPVGRRLAFDAARGRLWVVCRRCERWNLTPVEERWEAIEECERTFQGTRLRISTDNVGLARTREGLELVRIGNPLRPELAVWRYGDQFGRRHRRTLGWTVGWGAATMALVLFDRATGGISVGAVGLVNMGQLFWKARQDRQTRARLTLPTRAPNSRDPAGTPVVVRQAHAWSSSIGTDDEGWWLRVPYERDIFGFDRAKGKHVRRSRVIGHTMLRGEEALTIAGRLLPGVNSAGAGRKDIAQAVQLLEASSEPLRMFSDAALGRTPAPSTRWRRPVLAVPGMPTDGMPMNMLSLPTRLALEMATHEDRERRAMEGELALLETAWREAEEIAAISDVMFASQDDPADYLDNAKATT